MFQHSLLLIYRNFLRFKSSFLINLVGLSSGLACTLLIYLWVQDEMRVDQFNEKDSRLYQALVNHQNTDGITTAHATPALLAEALAAELPEVERAVATTSGIEMPTFLLSVEDKHVKAAGHFGAGDFFHMFSYGLTQGDAGQVLQDKNAIVLSEDLARKLFNTTENLIGRPVEWQVMDNKRQLFISGIFEGTPPNATDQFDFVVSFEIFKELIGPGHQDWGSTGPRTFVLLAEGADPQKVNAKITGFIKAKNPTSNADLFLRPFSERYLYDTYENGVQAGGRIVYVRLFSVIALFILVIACINFMNLSTAKASRRLKEVGIKKAMGARRQTLILQYLGESLVMASLALLLALLAVELFLPQFNQITGKQLNLTFSPTLMLAVAGITLLTGLLAGSYPAFHLSGFSPVRVLKGKLNPSTAEGWARQGLVVFQFTLSVLFIVSVLVVYRQISYIQNKNLGYDKEHVIYFVKEGKVAENQEAFLTEVRRLPGIVQASTTSHNLMGHKSRTTLGWEGKNPDDIIPFEMARVSFDLIETLGLQMAAGRTFSRQFSTDSAGIILNEAAIEVMGFRDPVGKTVNLWGQDRQIVGVVKNLHFESLHEKVKPMLFILAPAETSMVMVKMAAGGEQEVLSQLADFYQGFNPGFTFDYLFLDAAYQAQYVAEQRVAVLSRYFAGLAILISCLGLYGLAAFAAEQRTKEIGIRKVLGASVANIMGLLSKDFVILVSLAIVVGSAIAWYVMGQWLENFAYRIDLEWWVFALTGALALFIALLTVSFQAVKAALLDPVKSLRSE